MMMERNARSAVARLMDICHAAASKSGWWNDLTTGDLITIETPRIVTEKLCLIHSEVSEGMEGHRKNKRDEHLPHRSSLEVELADALIRICDTAAGFNLDLAGAVGEKLLYNAKRADHKPANRRKVDGKTF